MAAEVKMYRYSLATGFSGALDTFVEGWVMHENHYTREEFVKMVDECRKNISEPPITASVTANALYLKSIRKLLIDNYGFSMPPEVACNYWIKNKGDQ
jgi:hypothetical protein